MMMTRDADFEAFMRQWAKEHISLTKVYVDLDDALYVATQRSDHLTLLAAENGLYKTLREKAKPYGGVVQYIMARFNDATRMA
jgi:hypothetical protein